MSGPEGYRWTRGSWHPDGEGRQPGCGQRYANYDHDTDKDNDYPLGPDSPSMGAWIRVTVPGAHGGFHARLPLCYEAGKKSSCALGGASPNPSFGTENARLAVSLARS